MKVTLLKSDLSLAVTHAQRFVAARAQIPILGNIVLSATGAKLSVRATNLEMAIDWVIGAQVEESGEIAVPARTFADLIHALSHEHITLTSQKEELKIKSGSFNANMSAMNTSDFPDIETTLTDNAIEIDNNSFKNALEDVVFVASQDETRPELTGVLFIFEDSKLSLVASDGVRLSKKHVGKIEKKLKGESTRLIIPKAFLSELLRLFPDRDKITFDYQAENNQLVISDGKSFVSSRLIGGNFPPFEKIIPKNHDIEVVVGKKDLLECVKLASVFAREEANVIKFSISNNQLKVSTQSTKSGTQEHTIDAQVEGAELEISFNYKFIEDYINICEADEIKMLFINTDTPAVFEDKKDPDLLHLIMPVRVKS